MMRRKQTSLPTSRHHPRRVKLFVYFLMLVARNAGQHRGYVCLFQELSEYLMELAPHRRRRRLVSRRRLLLGLLESFNLPSSAKSFSGLELGRIDWPARVMNIFARKSKAASKMSSQMMMEHKIAPSVLACPHAEGKA